jgi:transcriptional regulator with XRE-family HTH domain
MQEENSQKVKVFSRRLRGLRSNLGITQSELASKLGLSLGTVGNWEAERNMPQGPLMRKLSEYFKVPVSFLLGEGPESFPGAASAEGAALRLQEGASYYNAAEGELPIESFSADPEVFWLEMFGDSMDPRILAGDRLLVSPNSTLENGDLVMAKKENGEIMVRVYIVTGKDGMFRLVAYNAIYGEQEWRKENFKFIYPVVGVWRRTKVRGLYQAVTEPEGNGK